MGKWHISMDPVQEWGEEVEDGAVFGVTLRREPVPHSSDPSDSESMASFSFIQYHTVKVRRLKAGTLERLITHLLDTDQQEAGYTSLFLSTYRTFTCTNTLIEMLFQREDTTANLDNTVCQMSTLLPVIRLWLTEYKEDLREPPHYHSLKLLCVHLRHRLCFRRLAVKAEKLLEQFQDEDFTSSQPSPQETINVEQPRVLKQKEVEEGSPAATVEEITLKTLDVMDFPAKDVAEQLTLLDAKLFIKVVPFHCAGCVWSQRDKNRNHAPTVRATIAQFNAVTNRVITSLLCPTMPSGATSSAPSSSSDSHPSSSSPRFPHSDPAYRAHVIEKWIAIAQECRQLRNFSSLRAILSALQSNAVYRLKRTWAAVSREPVASFDLLCETFPDENCVLTSREILVEDGSQSEDHSGSPKLCPMSGQTSSTCGIIPYLGTYLTVLTMLDTALPDTVGGGLINFEKRRREFEILSQIQQLQASCRQYDLAVNQSICACLQAYTLLTDQESYELSRELEPPVDPCPNSPSAWGHRLITKKLTSLLSASDGSNRKTHSDQISVSSSGSSGSEMEDVSSPPPLRLKLKSLASSLHNVAEGFSDSSLSSSSSPTPSSSSLPPDPSMSFTTPESSPSSCCTSSSSSPQASLPVYNKQVADSCIVRVSVECGNNGNVYKSILLTSQDHTRHVIERALEKHNLEGVSSHDFSLSQVLSQDKELLVPDKANVFYAMSTSANYDFVLRRRWKGHSKHLSSSHSPGTVAKKRHAK